LFLKTVRHFFPEFSRWLQDLPDTRFQPLVDYDRRFLVWYGLLLFVLQLSSRRALDQDLRDPECALIENINRLAGTAQESLPVAKTIDHFLGHSSTQAIAQLEHQCLQRLLRMKAVEDFRLAGYVVAAVDGTGFLRFGQRHCDHCLTQKHESKTVYLHPVLEVKLVTTNGLALSMASEFIENPGPIRAAVDYASVKQDCELKAFQRLAPVLKQAFPQLRLCLSGDSLYGCGAFFAVCQKHDWRFVVTFKPGRTPELWKEFKALLALEAQREQTARLPDGTRQVYRWVESLDYLDSEKRLWQLGAILCEETAPDGTLTTFAWLTDLAVNRQSVLAIANQGGRIRSKIENEGFNVQKNSGLNLEHAYSQDWDRAKAYYYLLQIGHLLMQLLHFNSGHLALAQAYGHRSVLALWGALKKIPQRLLEAFRYFKFADEDDDLEAARRCHLSLNTS
jgi:hypothetical protein